MCCKSNVDYLLSVPLLFAPRISSQISALAGLHSFPPYVTWMGQTGKSPGFRTLWSKMIKILLQNWKSEKYTLHSNLEHENISIHVLCHILEKIKTLWKLNWTQCCKKNKTFLFLQFYHNRPLPSTPFCTVPQEALSLWRTFAFSYIFRISSDPLPHRANGVALLTCHLVPPYDPLSLLPSFPTPVQQSPAAGPYGDCV